MPSNIHKFKVYCISPTAEEAVEQDILYMHIRTTYNNFTWNSYNACNTIIIDLCYNNYAPKHTKILVFRLQFFMNMLHALAKIVRMRAHCNLINARAQ